MTRIDDVMTRIIDEQLSALLDGELPAEQEAMLMRRLKREPEIRDKLARFGLIGELVRDASAQNEESRMSTLVDGNVLSQRVSAAIAAETGTMSRPDALPSPLQTRNLGFVGAAIAASIALIVIFNLADLGNTSRIPGVNAAEQSALVAHNDHQSARLTRYLVSHAQYSNSTSRQLVDSHLAMASVEPAVWASHE